MQNWITSSWLQDHKSSPLWHCVLDTLHSMWHKDMSESTSNGRAFSMKCRYSGVRHFLSQKTDYFSKNIHSSVKNKMPLPVHRYFEYYTINKYLVYISFSTEPVLKTRGRKHLVLIVQTSNGEAFVMRLGVQVPPKPQPHWSHKFSATKIRLLLKDIHSSIVFLRHATQAVGIYGCTIFGQHR